MDKYFAVELDTAEYEDESFQEYLGDHCISHRVIEEIGPGGGHPIVRYCSSYLAISKMIVDRFNDAWLLELIKQIDPVSYICELAREIPDSSMTPEEKIEQLINLIGRIQELYEEIGK